MVKTKIYISKKYISKKYFVLGKNIFKNKSREKTFFSFKMRVLKENQILNTVENGTFLFGV